MKTAVAFGTFDGLHPGHIAVLNATSGYKRAAVTFSFPPKFAGKGGGQLMKLDERLSCLKEIGMDRVECLDFEKVKDMSPETFLNFIINSFDVGLISCGYNFRFGSGASGDVETLKKFCREKGIKLVAAEPQKYGDTAISSSYIRDRIAAGDIALANNLLYRPYHYTSKVEKGDMRGRTIGFPTANQYLPSELVVPRFGVYSSIAVVDGISYNAVTDIGIRPTFKSEKIISETHIIGFSGELYGKEITVYPDRFLRDEKKFSSLEELKVAIKKDCSEVAK